MNLLCHVHPHKFLIAKPSTRDTESMDLDWHDFPGVPHKPSFAAREVQVTLYYCRTAVTVTAEVGRDCLCLEG